MSVIVRVFLVLLAVWSAGVCRADDDTVAPEHVPGAVAVSAEELVKLIYSNPGIVLIDSRKETEYLRGHIEGAINLLNLKMTRAELQRVAPDKSAAVLFYCNGIRCLRSSDAASRALEWGYRNVFWFRGGWQEWDEKKLPVIAGEHPGLSR